MDDDSGSAVLAAGIAFHRALRFIREGYPVVVIPRALVYAGGHHACRLADVDAVTQVGLAEVVGNDAAARLIDGDAGLLIAGALVSFDSELAGRLVEVDPFSPIVCDTRFR